MDAFKGNERTTAALKAHFSSMHHAPLEELAAAPATQSHPGTHWTQPEDATMFAACDMALDKKTGRVDWGRVSGFMFERGFDRSATAIRAHHHASQ